MPTACIPGADVALGLHAPAKTSPRVQEICAEAEEWVRPYLLWLERRKEGELDVTNSLAELEQKLDGPT